MIKKYIYSLLLFAFLNSTLDLTTNTNLAIYWGQNSYGGQNLNHKEKYEKDIEFYCDDQNLNNGQDIIMVSFLNNFNIESNKLPEINVANHCEDFYEEGPTYLHKCHHIGEGIKKCQKNKKTVILSLGGASSRTGFPNEASAIDFAHTLWNMYLGGNHTYRPFGDAVFDGIDLDIEGGTTEYYDSFVYTLRTLFNTTPSKKYYVTAAPQCVFPDASLHKVMSKAYLDMIYIQFYNNWCGVQNFRNIWAWNWEQWATWAKTESPNKNLKLFLGVPAARTAAGSGYIEVEELKTIIRNVSKSEQFGGVMMWDASQSENNLVGTLPYATFIKNFMVEELGKPPKNPEKPTESTSAPVSSTLHSSTTNSVTTKTSISSISITSTDLSPSRTTTKSTTSSAPAQVCPVDGEKCLVAGNLSCNGNYYAVCDNSKWLLRKCPQGTTCVSSGANVYCDHGDKPSCNI